MELNDATKAEEAASSRSNSDNAATNGDEPPQPNKNDKQGLRRQSSCAKQAQCQCCGWGCNCGPDCKCTKETCHCAATTLKDVLQTKLVARWRLENKTHTKEATAAKVREILGRNVTFSAEDGRRVSRPVDSKAHAQRLTEELENVDVPAVLERLQVVTGGATPNSQTATSKPYLATYTVSMTCGSCVRTVQNVLGATAIVDLSTKTVNLPVESRDEAEKWAEELEDVGLETRFEKLEALSPKRPNRSLEASAFGEDPLMRPLLSPSSIDSVGDPLVVAPPATSTVDMVVSGMTCAMCTKAITGALRAEPGVKNAAVSLATNLVTVEYESQLVSVPQLTEAIEAIGYNVEDVLMPNFGDEDHANEPNRLERLTQQQETEVDKKKWAFVWSTVGTFPILIFTMILPNLLPSKNALMLWLHQPLSSHTAMMRESLMLWILATPVQFGSGFSFYRTAYHNLQTRSLGMDVLVVLGTSASYGYAAYQALQGDYAHFFETSSVLICFVLLGKWMNAMAVRRTSEALLQLMELQAKTAIWVQPTDPSKIGVWDVSVGPRSLGYDPLADPIIERVVPVEHLQPGHVVKLIRGASIPADGVVTHGELTVDESMITGESVPVLKTPGSPVLGGTVCVETSGAFCCVTGVGAQTALHQIVALVQDAQSSQVPIQSLADAISAIFVPTVCTLSVVTFLIWYALCNTGAVPEEWYEVEGEGTFSLMFGIACLVISCPCALGLATPTAVMVGTGVGARHGVLIKGGEALETASKVNSVVFDKTGTLTKGQPAVTDFEIVGGCGSHTLDRQELLWWLGSLERSSEHPLALAVVKYAKDQIPDYLERKPFVQPRDFQASTGRGAEGVVDGTRLSVGNRAFCQIRNVAISLEVEKMMSTLEEDGKTSVVAAVNGEIAVVIGIADELKEEASAALQFLQNDMGIDVWMVTGDNARTGLAIARQLSLPPNRVISEALPVAKVQKVRRLQMAGKVVAMIGDGINDSPALAQADVGISFGTGTEIAAEASDMVLVKGHVADVCTALHLSQVIFRRIQWNFVFSLIYNCLGIPVAAGAFFPLIHTRLPPTVAALAMALSSMSVVFSSLALRLYRPPAINTTSSLDGGARYNVGSLANDNSTMIGAVRAYNRLRTVSAATEVTSNCEEDRRRRLRSRKSARRFQAVGEGDLTQSLLESAVDNQGTS